MDGWTLHCFFFTLTALLDGSNIFYFLRNLCGMSSLFLASAGGHSNTVSCLLLAGADPNSVTQETMSAFSI